jgi:Secretion system C-terminal sorting domain
LLQKSPHPQGGTPPYQIHWSSGDSTAAVGGLSSGSHSVTVTDNHECSAVEFFTGIEKITSLTSLEIFPNPTNSFLYLNALFSHRQKGAIKIYNLLGQAIFDLPFDGQQLHLEFDFSNKPAGTYLLEMVTDEGVVGEKVLALH